MEDKTQKLYQILYDKGLYTKTFDDFTAQFSDEVKKEKLFQSLNTKGLYTKSFDEFNSQFFPVKKKDLSIQDAFTSASGKEENQLLSQLPPSEIPSSESLTQTLPSESAKPRDTSVAGDLLRSLKGGSLRALGGITGIPQLLNRTVTGFALRPLVKGMGGTDEDANSLLDATLAFQPTGQAMLAGAEAQASLNKAATKTEAKIAPIEGNIVQNIKDGNWGQAGELLMRGVFQSAPYLAMTMATAGGGSAAVLGTIGATAASQQYGELEGQPEKKRILNAWLYGGFEAAGELVTAGIANGIGRAFKSGVIKEVNEDFVKGAVKELVKDFGLESSSEMGTQIGQNFTDIITGVDPNRRIFDNVLDAGLIGGVSGSGLGATHVGAAILGKTLASDKEVGTVQENTKQQEVLINQIEETDSDPVKKALKKSVKDLRVQSNEITDANYELAKRLPVETQNQVAELYSVWNELQSKIDNKEITEQEAPAIEKTIEGVKGQIQTIKEDFLAAEEEALKAKEKGVKAEEKPAPKEEPIITEPKVEEETKDATESKESIPLVEEKPLDSTGDKSAEIVRQPVQDNVQVNYLTDTKPELKWLEEDLPTKKPTKGTTVDVSELSGEVRIKPIPQKVKIKAEDDALINVVAKDEFRPVMGGVFYDAENQVKVGSDANVLTVIPTKITGKSRVINPKTKQEIVDVKYPNYLSVIPDNSRIVEVDATTLLADVSGAERANMFVDNGWGKGIGISAKIIYDGKEIWFDPAKLKKALLSLLESGTTNIRLELPETYNRAVVIRDVNNNKKLSLVMPIEVKDNPLTRTVLNTQTTIDPIIIQEQIDKLNNKGTWGENYHREQLEKAKKANDEDDIKYEEGKLKDEVDAKNKTIAELQQRLSAPKQESTFSDKPLVTDNKVEEVKPVEIGETKTTSTFPENITPDITTSKTGQIRFKVTDKESGLVVGKFNYHTVDVNGENYMAGGSLFVDEGFRGKGIGQNLVKLAMENLPSDAKGIYFKAETIHNQVEVPKIFEKLKADYDVTTAENGDVYLKPKEAVQETEMSTEREQEPIIEQTTLKEAITAPITEKDTEVPPPVESAVEPPKSGEETKFRRTQTNSLIQDQTLQQQEVAKIVDANKEKYIVLHGEDAVTQAKKMIDDMGVQGATLDLSERTKHMDEFPIRQVARQVLLNFYSKAIIDPNASEIDKTIAFKKINDLQQITAREATKAGQGSSLLQIWKSMQPAGVLEFVVRKIEQANNSLLDKKLGETTIGKQIDDLYNTLTEESKKIIDDIIAGREINVTTEVPVKGEPLKRKTVPKERIKQEQQYRKSLIEQYKKSQGDTMALSIAGLTSAQIELGGNLLASYVREGIYRTQDFIDSLKEDFKGIGVELNDKQAEELLNTQKDSKEGYADFSKRKEKATNIRAAEKLASKKINSVLKEHFTEKDELKRTLAQKLVDETGISEADAKKIEAEVLAAFDAEILKRSEKLMTKLIGTSKMPTTKVKQGMMGKMIDLINLGALDKELYTDLFSEKFKLSKLTEQHKAEILRLANNVQEASNKGWIERDATIRLAKYIYELYPQSKAAETMETWIAMSYANMLMGVSTTVLNTWSQGWNMSLKPVRDLTNLSKWLKVVKRGVKGDGFDVYNPFGEMFYLPMAMGTKMGWNEAKEVYINGDLNNKYIEDVAKKGQFKVTPLERNKYGKSQRFQPINIKIGDKVVDLNLLNKYKYSGRNLAAQDKLMLAASYDTEVAGILRDNLRSSNLTGSKLTKKVLDIYKGTHIDQKELDAQLKFDVQLYKKLNGEDMTDIQKRIRKRELVLEKLPLTSEEKAEAEMLARSSIFTDDRSGFFGTLAEGLSIAANSSPVTGLLIKPFVPFTKIVGNVAEYMLDHTPLYGFLRANGYSISALKKIVNSDWDTAQMGPVGSRAYYEQMGRAWFGTLAFSTAMAFLLGNDDKDNVEISGGYSEEGFKKGGRENVMPKRTLRIGSVKIPYMNIPGLAVPLGIIGDLNDGLKMNMDQGELEDRLTAALLLDAGLQSVTMIKDMSFVDGVQRLATLVGNVASTDEKKWGQIGKDVMKSYMGFATRPLPQNNNLVQQIWKIFDPTSYSQGDIASMLAYSAGIQHFVNRPSLDQLGDEIQSYPGETLLPYTHWLGIKGKDERWKLLAEYNAIPNKIYNRTMQIETKDGLEKRQMEADELFDYTQRAGKEFSSFLENYMADTEKVSKRGAEKIEREKANGETESINGIREDVEKMWYKAKSNAETELFRWGSVKEDMPEVWDLIKKNEAYHSYQASKSTGDYKWDKSDLYEYNNRATLRYAEKVEKYLKSEKATRDKKRVIPKKDISVFQEKINSIWQESQDYVAGKMAKQINAKSKLQNKTQK